MSSLYKEQAQRMYLWDFIPINEVLKDGITTTTKSGALVQVLTLSGLASSGLTDEEKDSLYQIRTNFLTDIEQKFKIKFIYDRKKTPHKESNLDFENIFAKELHQKHHSILENTYQTKMYCMVTLETKYNNNIEVAKGQASRSLEELNKRTQSIIAVLSRYHAQYLSNKKTRELTKFWAERINIGFKSILPPKDKNLFKTLALTNISFNASKGIVELSNNAEKKYVSVLRINTYPDQTTNDMLITLMQARYDYSIIQNVQLYDDKTYIENCTKKVNTFSSFMDSSVGEFLNSHNSLSPATSELQEIINDLSDKLTRMLEHQFSIIVKGDTLEELQSAIEVLQNIMAVQNINAQKETTNLEGAFWAQFPTLEALNKARSYDISAHDLANFASFTSTDNGFQKCAFGNTPVMSLLTTEDTVYDFIFQENESPEASGSTLVVAATGQGKTTFMMDLIANSLAYGGNNLYGGKFKALLFDNENGLKSQVACFDGQHIDLSNPKNLPMNPFLLKKTPENMQFLVNWVKLIGSEKGELNAKEELAIEKWVNQIMSQPPNERDFSVAKDIIGNLHYDEGKDTLLNRFEKWMPHDTDPEKNSINAMYFNAKKDALHFDKQIVCFEMGNTLKNNKDLIAPIFSYIYHAFTQSMKNDPSPHMIFVDEAKAYLQNPIACEFIEDMILKIRKVGGIVVLAAQDPSHILDCSRGESIGQNLATKILFPNVDASYKQYKNLGLNDNEIKWLQENEGKRQVMIKKKGLQSVIVKIDFTYYGELIHLITGNHKDTKMLEDMEIRFPEYEPRIREFMKEKHQRFEARK